MTSIYEGFNMHRLIFDSGVTISLSGDEIKEIVDEYLDVSDKVEEITELHDNTLNDLYDRIEDYKETIKSLEEDLWNANMKLQEMS